MIEVWVIVGTWVTAGVAVGVVIVTWQRNGKSQAKRDERLELNQQNIMNTLGDPSHGLTAMNDKVNNLANHCASVTAGFAERINAAERDIKELKVKR